MEPNKIKTKIEKKKRELKELENQLKREQDKSEWVKISELKIEIQSKIHHKGKSYDELKEEFGEEYLEEHLPTYDQLQTLKNLEHEGKYNIGLKDTWEFVKQEDLFMKEKGRVARFYADSGYAYLYCYENPSLSNSYLGVRFVRALKVGSK